MPQERQKVRQDIPFTQYSNLPLPWPAFDEGQNVSLIQALDRYGLMSKPFHEGVQDPSLDLYGVAGIPRIHERVEEGFDVGADRVHRRTYGRGRLRFRRHEISPSLAPLPNQKDGDFLCRVDILPERSKPALSRGIYPTDRHNPGVGITCGYGPAPGWRTGAPGSARPAAPGAGWCRAGFPRPAGSGTRPPAAWAVRRCHAGGSSW